MSDAKEITQLEEAAKVLEEALQNDDHEFWTKFGQEWEGHGTVDELREQLQKDDDEKRKKQGLEPRPWYEIEKEMEEQSNRSLESFDENLMEWDNQQRKSQGLEPRSKEQMEEDVMPKISGLLHDVIYKYDTQKRQAKGLPRRPREEFEEVLKDGPEALGH
ncbi:MAG: hypothetical protein Q9216_004450 [Gyalolechia sp. 2 TL-2023]